MYIGCDNKKIRELNWEKRIDALKITLNMWNCRNLTISGRAFLAKSLCISKCPYISSVSPVDQQIINNINSILYVYIWKGQNKERIKRNMLMSKPDHGGLNKLDLESMIKSPRIKLLTKYFDDSDSFWKTTFETFCENYEGVNSLHRSNYDMKFIDIKPKFYKEVLDAWSILCKETIRENYSWNNRCIKIANKPVFFKDFAQRKVSTI